MRKRDPLEPYRRPLPRVLRRSQGGGRFLMSEVPLQVKCSVNWPRVSFFKKCSVKWPQVSLSPRAYCSPVQIHLMSKGLTHSNMFVEAIGSTLPHEVIQANRIKGFQKGLDGNEDLQSAQRTARPSKPYTPF